MGVFFGGEGWTAPVSFVLFCMILLCPFLCAIGLSLLSFLLYTCTVCNLFLY